MSETVEGKQIAQTQPETNAMPQKTLAAAESGLPMGLSRGNAIYYTKMAIIAVILIHLVVVLCVGIINGDKSILQPLPGAKNEGTSGETGSGVTAVVVLILFAIVYYAAVVAAVIYEILWLLVLEVIFDVVGVIASIVGFFNKDLTKDGTLTFIMVFNLIYYIILCILTVTLIYLLRTRSG